MSKITASADFDRVKPEDLPRFLTLFGEQVIQVINGGQDFATNFNAKTVSLSFASANTDTAVAHGLGRAPIGYIVTGRSAAMTIYDGETTNTNSALYLRSSAIGSASVLVF